MFIYAVEKIIEKCQAKFVARSRFSPKNGVDYEEIFVAVVRWSGSCMA